MEYKLSLQDFSSEVRMTQNHVVFVRKKQNLCFNTFLFLKETKININLCVVDSILISSFVLILRITVGDRSKYLYFNTFLFSVILSFISNFFGFAGLKWIISVVRIESGMSVLTKAYSV